jgi:hypothetical protein
MTYKAFQSRKTQKLLAKGQLYDYENYCAVCKRRIKPNSAVPVCKSTACHRRYAAEDL